MATIIEGTEVLFSRVDAKVNGTFVQIDSPDAYPGQATDLRRTFPVTKGRIYQFLSRLGFGDRVSHVIQPLQDGEINQTNTLGLADSPIEVRCYDVT